MPRRAGMAALTLAAVMAVLAIVVIALVSSKSSSDSHTSPASQESQSGGASFPGDIAATDFTLTDQYGRHVSLDQYRGRVVMLSFLYSTCGAACIVIAQQMRGALNELQEEHVRLPAVLIVSADPTADTRARVASFLASVSLSGRVQYLTGTLAQLRRVWRAYGVKPASAGAAVFDEYAPVLLLDPAGHKRVLFESEELTPEALSQDIRKLGGGLTDP